MPSIMFLTIIISALFLMIEGLYMRFNELYYMCGVLLSMPFVSYMVTRFALYRLQCVREMPEYMREDETAVVRVHLLGNSRFLGSIIVDDSLPEWIEKTDDSEDTVDWDSSGQGVVSYSVTARKRGEYKIEVLRLWISDPLGFFSFSVRFRISSRLVVFPSSLEVPGLTVTPSGMFSEFETDAYDGRGAKGSGVDFHGVREYQTGDELRRIHWPSTARHGTLSVMEFEETRLQDTVVALDLQEGSETGVGRNTSLEYAVKIAAGVSEQILLNGSRVRLLGAGIHGPSTIPGSGIDHLYAILETLAGVQADQKTSISDVLMQESGLLARGSFVVCFVSSVSTELVLCVEALVYRGIGVRIIQLTFPKMNKGEELPANRLTERMITVLECSSGAMWCKVK